MIFESNASRGWTTAEAFGKNFLFIKKIRGSKTRLMDIHIAHGRHTFFSHFGPHFQFAPQPTHCYRVDTRGPEAAMKSLHIIAYHCKYSFLCHVSSVFFGNVLLNL